MCCLWKTQCLYTILLAMAEKVRIYNCIKVMLVKRRKSNLDLAAHLKKEPRTVSRYMTNHVQPPINVLFEIADFLQCDAKDLLVSSLEPPTYVEE